MLQDCLINITGIRKGVEWLSTPVWGELALLLVAIVLLRLMPQGITGRYFKGKV